MQTGQPDERWYDHAMNNVGRPLLLAQSLDNIARVHGHSLRVGGMELDIQMAPTKIEQVSRAHDRQTHEMTTRLTWEDDELGMCVADISQKAVDVVDREDFSRQVVDPAQVQQIKMYADLGVDGDVSSSRATATLGFDNDGELVFNETSASLHDPMAQAAIEHALNDRMRICYDTGWQAQLESEEPGQQQSLDL